MKYAPIILFVYNRPDHTEKTITALQKNNLAKESDLFIFSDAAKTDKDIQKVQEVRDLIKNISGFRNIYITKRAENFGLAKSIITGVTDIVNKYDRAIVLEDDIVTSPFFLNYMNDALELYKDEEKVMHISGYFFPVSNKKKFPDTFLYQQTSCWSWATWKRAWKHFNPDATYLLDKIKEKNLEYKFNIDGSTDSFINQLVGNINGTIKTWAIKWQASVFLLDGLSLHPKNSFAKNIGNDETGTNVGATNVFNVKLASSYKKITKIPIEESLEARESMRNFYKKIKNPMRTKLLKYVKKITKYSLQTIKNPINFKENFNLLKISVIPRFTIGGTKMHGNNIAFPDSASFMYMNKEIFIKKIYDFQSSSTQPYIIDGGANIGLATIFFKRIYPDAHIVAFEPDPYIFEILEKNLTSFKFKNVQAIKKGLWTKEDTLSFVSDGSDGGRIKENDALSTKIEVVRLKDYINRHVDFLKLDIEGSEVEVIEDCADVLKNIDNIFVEYHSFRNKKQDLDKILNILSNNGFRYYIETVGQETYRPFINKNENTPMDMQLNIFATKNF